MNPIVAALVSAFTDAVAQSVAGVLQTYLARKDIQDVEKHKATIVAQGFVIAGQQWAIRALSNPDGHDFLRDLGGKLEPVVPSGAGGSTVQPGVPS